MASEILSVDSDLIVNKIFGNYSCNNLNTNINLSINSNQNSQEFQNLPIFRLIFYFNKYNQDEFNITIPGYIDSIISNISIRCPQKLQEIVINNQEKIVETYSYQIDNDSIRQILLNLLTIKADLNVQKNFNYNKNLNERYLTTCLNIIDKLLSFYLQKFYGESKTLMHNYFTALKEMDQNDKKFHIEFLEKLYNYKFKIKNLFILIFKFLKFVDVTYPNKLDDIILKIFQYDNLKNIEKIIFNKNTILSNKDNLSAADIYILEEFLFFFSYFLKISFNKRNSNKDYLLNNFFIDDYENIYSQSNGQIDTNASDVTDRIEEIEKTNEGINKEVSQIAIEDKVLSAGENITGKIDNLYSCSFNLEEKLNDSTKLFLLEFYLTNFQNFYNLVICIKNFYADFNNSQDAHNTNIVNKHLFKTLFFAKAVSTSYVYFLDCLIVLFDQNKKEFSLKKLVGDMKFPHDLFKNLINDILEYKANPFVHIKILRIFELLRQKENSLNADLLNTFLEMKIIDKELIVKLLEELKLKDYIDLQK